MLLAMTLSCVRVSRILPSLAMSLVPLASGCLEPRTATQVTVYVDAQSMVRAETRVLEVVVRGGAPGDLAETPESPYRFDAPIDWPRDFTFVPLGGDLTRYFEVDAIAYDANRRIITIARLRGGFSENAARTLRLTLEDRCRGIVCPSDYTCRSGGCVQLVDPDPDAGADLDAGVPADAAPLLCTTDEACDDGVVCNGVELCKSGLCTPGDIVVCDDGVRCTQDVCTGGGCMYLPDHGMCNVDPSGRCDVETGCQYDTCDVATTCAPEACQNTSCEGTLCRRSSACSAGESCCAGACVPRGCDDSIACTSDFCAEGSSGARGCQHEPRVGSCSDGNACTVGDTCSASTCTSGTPESCADDGNPCTVAMCDPIGGCSHVPLDMEYDDGDFCTVGERCSGGVLIAGTANLCDDGVFCTRDSCSAGTCAHNPDARRCSGPVSVVCDLVAGCQVPGACDASTCIPADVCETAACSTSTCVRSPVTCIPDSNPCTDTVCVPGGGCMHVPNAAGCSDGNPCTTGDHCEAGACAAGTAIACNDGNPCTTDTCSGGSCTSAPLADGGTCNDGNPCSLGDRCVSGACSGSSTDPCNDGNACTTDACNPATGCVNAASPAGTSCGLIFECTQEVCDGSGACVSQSACTGTQLCCDGFCRRPQFCEPFGEF